MSLLKDNYLKFGLVVSFFATVGSLIFSEIMKLQPCVLCWYQRIFMYPLVFIFAIGIWKKDKNITNYIIPLSVTGAAIAIYHNLLYYKILPESVAPCTLGISCTTKQIEWLGFISIPLLSLISFLTIIFLAILHRKYSR